MLLDQLSCVVAVFTNRCSVAKRGGCFQQRLFVCVSVCLHDNFRTIQLGMMKLGSYMHFTKISPEFECQGQRSRSPGTEAKKTAESSPLTMHSRAFTVRRRSQVVRSKQQQTMPLRGRPGVTSYAGWKISTCCVVLQYYLSFVSQCCQLHCCWKLQCYCSALQLAGNYAETCHV